MREQAERAVTAASEQLQAATRETVELVLDRMILTLEHETEVSAVVARAEVAELALAARVRALEQQLDAPVGGCWLDALGGAKKKAAKARAEAEALQARVEKLGDVTVGPRLLKKGGALIEDASKAMEEGRTMGKEIAEAGGVEGAEEAVAELEGAFNKLRDSLGEK